MGHKPKKFTLEGKAVYDEKTGQLVYKASLFEWVSGILVSVPLGNDRLLHGFRWF